MAGALLAAVADEPPGGVGMMGSAVLRINDVPLGDGGRRRVEVSWQDGPARQVAASPFTYQVDGAEAEKVRWYLEDYPEFPADPGPRLATDAEAVLAQIGAGLFTKVFTGMDAAGIWAMARPRLGQVRVEVDTDPGEVPGLPWELLRDPGTDTALALSAGTFVRTHLQATARASLPQPGGDTLRVLLVICRPGGRADVPFRSVASRLARGGAARMDGLDLDVLRPATFARLSEVLHEAADAGRPYHVVHFDGHGIYLDLNDLAGQNEGEGADGPAAAGASRAGGGGIGVSPLRYGISVAGPVRSGQHGYLIFEDRDSPTNQQLVDGPALGRLLAATGVPVLVLNACRSAYTEASPRPGEPGQQSGETTAGDAAGSGAARTGPAMTVEAESGVAGTGTTADVHARIRAYGSLAAEVADVGVPGVVAMRYNVYVVTAAQYAADLYAHLLAGRSLGEAATAARRALADNPTRQIGTAPVALQDWAVPVVYEAAPLTLLQPGTRDTPLIRVTTSDGSTAADGTDGLPRPPDAGFFGRDETLLALDRAFDTHQVILLRAFAGSGKTSTAAEFARWYQATGGLRHPSLRTGPMLWTSFEHHLTLDRLLATVGDCFAPLLEANGIHWAALTDAGQRRDLALQLLAEVPVLWVWDNIEEVNGFPLGTPSAWTRAEQDDLADFLGDLARTTQCKVLLTSRRDERHWLHDLPTRVTLPPMPMRERLQLACALATRYPQARHDVEWRPLLRYTAGNPLTITVLVSQALRNNLTTTDQLRAFVSRLQIGEQELEPGEDSAMGRPRSLAASLSYGFTHTFTDKERAQLALLHLFRNALRADALWMMGDPEIAKEDVVPEVAVITRDNAIALLNRATEIGLLTLLGTGYYAIHPALPWYFTSLYSTAYGPSEDQRAVRAYAHAIAGLGSFYYSWYVSGGGGDAVRALGADEANLHHALTIARANQQWEDMIGCMQGLRVLCQHTGREGEWARLVHDIVPDFIDPVSDGPLPGREEQWAHLTDYRVKFAFDARDWSTATHLQNLLMNKARQQAAKALAAQGSKLTAQYRAQIGTLLVTLEHGGHILLGQQDPGCLHLYQEALTLAQRIEDRQAESRLATHLGNTYMNVPGLRDLREAERWQRHSLELAPDHDRIGRGKTLGSLSTITYQRFLEAFKAHQPETVLLEHLNAALQACQQALDLFPADDAVDLAYAHRHLGDIYTAAQYARQAMHHYQQALKHYEALGDTYHTGVTRTSIARLLINDRRLKEALYYAHAALHDLDQVGPGAIQTATELRSLIANLERDSESTTRQ